MKKTYKIDVDCANCANKMEEAARKTEGVQSATVNFMALKMIVEFAEGQDPKAVMEQVGDDCGPGQLQEGGGRLRNLPVSAFFRKAPPPEAGCFLSQNN